MGLMIVSIVKLVSSVAHARGSLPATVLVPDALDDAPANGLSCLYGPSDILAEMSRRRQAAMRDNLAMTTIEIRVDVGDAKAHKLAPEEIKAHRVIHLRRLKEEFRSGVIGGYWREWAEANNIKTGFDPMTVSHPAFVGYLHDQVEFRHLDVIEFFVRGNHAVHQAAILFSDRRIIGIEATGAPNTKLVLPDSVRASLQAAPMPEPALVA
jgi:hypothetical protein